MLTLQDVVKEDNDTITNYACDFIVSTAGDGLWGCEAGRQVRVTGISIVETVGEDYSYTMVNVTHDSTWDIYTDSAFEEAISNVLGYKVAFTEQGMQENNFASMEV